MGYTMIYALFFLCTCTDKWPGTLKTRGSYSTAGTQQQLEHSDVASEYSGLESDDEEEAPTSKRPRTDNRIESD